MLAEDNVRVCANCGRANTGRALFCQGCGSSLESAPTTSSSRAATAVAPMYGGFWKRVLASVIDWFVVIAGLSVLSLASFGVALAPGILLPWIYEALMTSSDKQATIGKIVLGLVVTGPNGERLTFARATGRHFAKYLSALALCIGFIMVAFTARKQGLHDIIAETFVIHGTRPKFGTEVNSPATS